MAVQGISNAFQRFVEGLLKALQRISKGLATEDKSSSENRLSSNPRILIIRIRFLFMFPVSRPFHDFDCSSSS